MRFARFSAHPRTRAISPQSVNDFLGKAVRSLFSVARVSRARLARAPGTDEEEFLALVRACVRDAGSNLEAALQMLGHRAAGEFPLPMISPKPLKILGHPRLADRLYRATWTLAALCRLTEDEFSRRSSDPFTRIAVACLTDAGLEVELVLVGLGQVKPGRFPLINDRAA